MGVFGWIKVGFWGLLTLLLFVPIVMNSTMGMPVDLSQPGSDCDVEQGYVDWMAFFTGTCEDAVLSAEEQALPFFTVFDLAVGGVGLVALLFLLLGVRKQLSSDSEPRFRARRQRGGVLGEWQEPEVPAAEVEDMSRFGGMPGGAMGGAGMGGGMGGGAMGGGYPGGGQQGQQEDSAFHNPFDF